MNKGVLSINNKTHIHPRRIRIRYTCGELFDPKYLSDIRTDAL